MSWYPCGDAEGKKGFPVKCSEEYKNGDSSSDYHLRGVLIFCTIILLAGYWLLQKRHAAYVKLFSVSDAYSQEQMEVAQLSLAIQTCLQEGHPGRLITGAEANNAHLASLLTGEQAGESGEKHRYIQFDPARIGAKGFIDHYGHPYHIRIGLSNTVNVGAKTIDAPEAVWSDGKNGVNESGGGDDPHSWKLSE
jgi:hypothetical protein